MEQPKDISIDRSVFDLTFWIFIIIGLIVTGLVCYFKPELIIWFLVIGIIFIAGYLPTRIVGRDERRKRALESKKAEDNAWGFWSRDREGPWINFINFPLLKESKYADDRYFYSQWLIIHNGTVVVNPGYSYPDLSNKTVRYDFSKKRTYAWDGCTPKVYFLWLFVFGTPDWWQVKEPIMEFQESGSHIRKEKFWQMTLHASLVHDALYQYLHIIPMNKSEVDWLFYDMLKDSGMWAPVAKLYHMAVRFSGAKKISEHMNNPNSDYTLINDWNS